MCPDQTVVLLNNYISRPHVRLVLIVVAATVVQFVLVLVLVVAVVHRLMPSLVQMGVVLLSVRGFESGFLKLGRMLLLQ